MKSLFLLLTLFGAVVANAYELQAIRFSGEGEAKLEFITVGSVSETPQTSTRDNVVEVSFPAATLPPENGQKVDYASPHSLVQSAVLLATDNGVKARLVIKGSAAKLKERLNWAKGPRSVTLKIAYPEGASANGLGLLTDEEKPLHLAPQTAQAAAAGMSWVQVLLVTLVLIGAGVATVFFVRFTRKQSKWKGNRKYLVEQMAYCPMGPKAGVSLLKVGKEFVLVGVTPQSINFLSSVPKLEAQYEEDSKFERGVFQEAVEEEFRRTRKSSVNA